MRRNATAVWNGTGKDGKGTLTTQSGAFSKQPYSARMRFENEDGKLGTNPEELIGAAHAGCFAMALSFALTNAGFPPDELEVKATVNLAAQEGGGHNIDKIQLDLRGRVPGIDESQFQELANKAKQTCPVSKVLNAEISLDARLEQ